MKLGSLRQLTLFSFALALVPLFMLLMQSQRDLSGVWDASAKETRFVIGIVTQVRELEAERANADRRLRQYQVIQSDTAKLSAQVSLLNTSKILHQICGDVEVFDSCGAIAIILTELSQFENTSSSEWLSENLSQLTQSMDALSVQINAHIQQRGVEQQQALIDRQTKQAWMTAVLVTISLGLVILGSQLIVKPVEALQSLIKTIAKQHDALPPVSAHGPKELIAVEHDLHWLADRLTQLEHIRTALLRHASHELKTPLASIKEGTSLLQEEVVGPLTAPQKEVLSLLDGSAKRLNTLIEKLLDYNLLLQQAKASVVKTNIVEMVSQCVADYALALQEHDVVTTINAEWVYVDIELTRRILDNLVSNAVAHGTKQEPIYITVETADNQLIIDVANHGEPIPVDKAKNLFQPFVRGEGKRNDKVMGAGLGLSIVSDCARIQQGKVDIVTVDYAQVCFRVTLPQNGEIHG